MLIAIIIAALIAFIVFVYVSKHVHVTILDGDHDDLYVTPTGKVFKGELTPQERFEVWRIFHHANQRKKYADSNSNTV